MPTIAITGGIASGKSSFREILLSRMDAEYFNTDACARQLLEDDDNIRNRVIAAFTERAYRENCTPDRTFLRETVFNDFEKKQLLEAILHPAIRERWAQAAEKAIRPFFVEIPLLFETDAQNLFDRIVTVACPEAFQIERLVNDRNISVVMARKILASQCTLNVKIRGSDHVVWNDGPPSLLESQADHLASFLNSQYD